MSTGTTKKAKITATSTENFFDVESSNCYDHYPLIMTGPGACRCGCPAGEKLLNCYHRATALKTLVYVFPDAAYRFQVLEEGLREVNAVLGAARVDRIETEAELDAYREMNEAA